MIKLINMHPQLLEQFYNPPNLKILSGLEFDRVMIKVIMAFQSTVMIVNKKITVVITVIGSGDVTNLPHYKNSRPENYNGSGRGRVPFLYSNNSSGCCC